MTIAFHEPKYEIEASDFRCLSCSEEIPCDGSYFSAVLYQDGAFRRRNFCLKCWKVDAAGLFAYWKTKRPPLPADQPRRVRFDTQLVFELFRRLGEGVESPDGPPPEDREELRFVLSLLLVRKKVLNFVSAYQTNGAEILKMTEKADPARVHWVKNPELSDSQLERVKVRIGDLLQMQL